MVSEIREGEGIIFLGTIYSVNVVLCEKKSVCFYLKSI